MAVLLALILAQADDPATVAAALDAAIRKIPGYNAAAEAKPVGDDAFLRRVFNDLVGTSVTEADLKAFAADVDPMKRSKMVDRLLADGRFDIVWARRFSR